MTLDRSAVTRAVKSRDTGPERAVRAMLLPLAETQRFKARLTQAREPSRREAIRCPGVDRLGGRVPRALADA